MPSKNTHKLVSGYLFIIVNLHLKSTRRNTESHLVLIQKAIVYFNKLGGLSGPTLNVT